ncbi:hypothetical protein SAMN02927924_04570 [Sphingobium faniae]|nr:hypothetical protein SAMN02927924_04570 [Sphingobium faniae]
MYTKWSASEDGLLRNIYPDYPMLEARLPNRTLSAIKHHVQALGIVRRRHIWTNVEVARLRKAYRKSVADKELTILFSGLRLCQIKSKASYIGAERRIAKRHNRKGFDCGQAELNDFLAKYARQAHDSGASKTYAAVDAADGRRSSASIR